jgi:putative glycosyltransferase (TIGR04348 family)
MVSLAKPVLRIVTPGTREANNGNWRTAVRWAGMLRDRYSVIVQTAWEGEPADAMIALHARRSATSVRAFREANPGKRLAVVLTGTDLYRDLPGDAQAAASLALADRLVTLQEDAPGYVPRPFRAKCIVIFQSAPALRPLARKRGRIDAIVVGHLRPEKDPGTLFGAVKLLPPGLAVRIRHIGAPLDAALGRQARALARREPRYRWTGALAHGLTRAAIHRADVLVHPSRLEGGANVIVEAVMGGTPVIASRMSGNVGMLGADYPGYFDVGDGPALARCLERALESPRYLRDLRAACALRRPLFRPQAEARALRALVEELIA